MKWLIQNKGTSRNHRRNAVPAWDGFNSTLAENEGGLCSVEVPAAVSSENAADTDIREGRIKKFDNVDDMIAALKLPW